MAGLVLEAACVAAEARQVESSGEDVGTDSARTTGHAGSGEEDSAAEDTATSGSSAGSGGAVREPPPSHGFLAEADVLPETHECDIWAEDCPAGHKCMPFANDGGGAWNSLRCTPIAPEPRQPGETCTVVRSGVSGIDDCELHSMCWEVDPATNMGTCASFCEGHIANPKCLPGSRCIVLSLFPLCLPACDPLSQGCSEGRGCYPINEDFVCVPDSSGPSGAAGDPCEFLNLCDPGNVCAGAVAVPGCVGPSCCTSFCAVGEASLPCLEGQLCAPYFEEGQAPAGYESIGLCTAVGA